MIIINLFIEQVVLQVLFSREVVEVVNPGLGEVGEADVRQGEAKVVVVEVLVKIIINKILQKKISSK
jgi:hypothetical protein